MKKIRKYEGCFGPHWNVDGKGFDHEKGESPEKDEALIEYLIEKLKEGIKDGEISFDDLMHCFHYSDYEDGGTCGTCGHYDGTTIWEI